MMMEKETVNPKVLISTPWYPTKTYYFTRYSNGILRQLGIPGIEADLFITTYFHEWKTGSILGAMNMGSLYALENGYTHYFNVDADCCLGKGVLEKLLEDNKPVVIGNPHGKKEDGLHLRNPKVDRTGWMIMLVETWVLKTVPMNFHVFDYFSHCDVEWYKRVRSKKIDIWVENDIEAEQMDMTPNENYCFGKSFKPEGKY